MCELVEEKNDAMHVYHMFPLELSIFVDRGSYHSGLQYSDPIAIEVAYITQEFTRLNPRWW